MRKRWWQKTRFRWAAVGAVFSFIGPLGEWGFLAAVGKPADNALGWTFVFVEIWTLLLFASFGFLLGRSRERIEQFAFLDTLTGAHSRGYLMEQFKELLAVHDRYQQPLGLILFDLDRFKNVNDRYGHPVGDQTLKAVAERVGATCRAPDVLGRYGGEEFLILCPNTGPEDVRKLAERIRKDISGLPPEKLGYPGPQTASFGVMCATPGSRATIGSLLEVLDEALYRAKAGGRDQVQAAPRD